MSDELKEGTLPEPVLKLEDARKENLEDELVGLPLPKAIKKLLAEGYVIRYCHDHNFECGGEEKRVINILATQE